MTRTVEEALRRARDGAAFLTYVAGCAAVCPEAPSSAALCGLADVCGDIEEMVRAVQKSLDVDTLGIELKRLKEED